MQRAITRDCKRATGRRDTQKSATVLYAALTERCAATFCTVITNPMTTFLEETNELAKGVDRLSKLADEGI